MKETYAHCSRNSAQYEEVNEFLWHIWVESILHVGLAHVKVKGSQICVLSRIGKTYLDAMGPKVSTDRKESGGNWRWLSFINSYKPMSTVKKSRNARPERSAARIYRVYHQEWFAHSCRSTFNDGVRRWVCVLGVQTTVWPKSSMKAVLACQPARWPQNDQLSSIFVWTKEERRTRNHGHAKTDGEHVLSSNTPKERFALFKRAHFGNPRFTSSTKFTVLAQTSVHHHHCRLKTKSIQKLADQCFCTKCICIWVSRNQNSIFAHFLSYLGTPKMVPIHIKYGKAGCDQDITPCLGVCDKDITTLSVHALIVYCLGNSHVTCQKAQSPVTESLLTLWLEMSLFSFCFAPSQQEDTGGAIAEFKLQKDALFVRSRQSSCGQVRVRFSCIWPIWDLQ